MLLGRSWISRTFVRTDRRTDWRRGGPTREAFRKVLDIQDLRKDRPETWGPVGAPPDMLLGRSWISRTFVRTDRRTDRRRGGPTREAFRKVLDIQDLRKDRPETWGKVLDIQDLPKEVFG